MASLLARVECPECGCDVVVEASADDLPEDLYLWALGVEQ